MAFEKGTIRERFERRVVPMLDGCWIWIGGLMSSGYGAVRGIDGSMTGAHRLAHEIYIGPIPEGLNVLHRCDVKPCVRPAHLWAGTQGENIVDMYSKGRAPEYRRRDQTGERNPLAKLTDQEVVLMREMFAAGARQADLARIFDTRPATVWCIVRGKSRAA